MQTRSEIWKQLAQSGTAILQAYVEIAGKEYVASTAPVISRGLFSSAYVGNATSASLQITILTDDDISKGAEVKCKMRYASADGATVSEWLPAGTYYIASREKDYITGLLTLSCYDIMYRANSYYYADESEEESDATTYPVSFTAMVQIIANNLGVEIDSRTELPASSSYAVTKPSSSTTLNNILADIAGCCGGNWIITPENKLRLVSLKPQDDTEYEVSAVLSKLTVGKNFTITGVAMSDADGNAFIQGTGALVVPSNPYANADICKDLYEKLSGYTYIPYTMGSAVYDPAIELGDRLTYASLISSQIVSEAITLSSIPHGEVKAPSISETEDEYPYISTVDRTVKKETEIVKKEVEELTILLEEAQKTLEEKIAELEAIVDNTIETWFESGIPTLENYPASEWTDDETRAKHVGDLYYNSDNGFCYRFTLDHDTGAFEWVLIQDNDVTKALEELDKALEAERALEEALAEYQARTDAAIAELPATILAEASETFESKDDAYSMQIELEASISTNAAGLESLASRVDSAEDELNGISATYATKSELTQTAAKISTSVSHIETIANEASDAAADALEKATENEVELNGFGTRLTTAESSITQTAESVSVIVDELQDYDEKITSLQVTSENISSQVTSLATTTDGISDTVSSLSTQFVQTSDSFEASISTMQDNISELVGTVACFSFTTDSSGNGVLTISTTANGYSVKLSNSQLTFLSQGKEVAYINGDSLYISNANITSELDMGAYAWVPSSNGRLSLKYVG